MVLRLVVLNCWVCMDTFNQLSLQVLQVALALMGITLVAKTSDSLQSSKIEIRHNRKVLSVALDLILPSLRSKCPSQAHSRQVTLQALELVVRGFE